MRHHGRTICLAVINYQSGDAVIGVRCQKDCRHGHARPRKASMSHRWDGHLPDGAKIKITWDGVGVMPPEIEKERAEMKADGTWKKGFLTWDGDHHFENQ